MNQRPRDQPPRSTREHLAALARREAAHVSNAEMIALGTTSLAARSTP